MDNEDFAQLVADLNSGNETRIAQAAEKLGQMSTEDHEKWLRFLQGRRLN